MSERCPNCHRPVWDDGDLVTSCFAKGDANCELYCQLTAALAKVAELEALFQRTHNVHHGWVAKAEEAIALRRAKLTKLEAVVKAADEVVRISDREHEAWVAYRAAKAELEKVERPEPEEER